MNYNFPHLQWNLDAVLLGSGRQRVPLMMYIHAHYFFVVRAPPHHHHHPPSDPTLMLV